MRKKLQLVAVFAKHAFHNIRCPEDCLLLVSMQDNCFFITLWRSKQRVDVKSFPIFHSSLFVFVFFFTFLTPLNSTATTKVLLSVVSVFMRVLKQHTHYIYIFFFLNLNVPLGQVNFYKCSHSLTSFLRFTVFHVSRLLMFYLHGQVYLLITKNCTFKWYIRDIFECMSQCVYIVVPLKSKTDTNVTASICTSLLHQEMTPRPDNNYQRIAQIERERERVKKN